MQLLLLNISESRLLKALMGSNDLAGMLGLGDMMGIGDLEGLVNPKILFDCAGSNQIELVRKILTKHPDQVRIILSP